ncbi:phage terminase large subunit family protein [Bradyrhizobium elkanii]|uniref:phage terminase large subunit family protein n=1 Tax=Bradyrhizobium elkanii TaxID=29448 RepID=UPI002167E25C|nr:phage terminase large subunit family protein [Bradyrhizobium elkanii]MCS3689084.1 phage terminase large subunit GpA-like protein [Bradyrhizobium elkanii]
MIPEILSCIAEAAAACRAPEKLNLVEWSDRYRHIPAKVSASPGTWRTAAQPLAYGPMLAVSDDSTHTVTIMSGTQVLKTELLINAAMYYAHHEPASVLLVQPTQSSAESFSKERLAPSIEASPALRDLFAIGAHDETNTITAKQYPGGALNIVGANSPTDLASRPKRVILCDEIDKYPVSAGAEGDPLKLAEERASTYAAIGRAKFVRTCSPTVKGESRIGREYAASDQRRLYVQCPHCLEHQTLSWANVKWSKDEAGEHLPETAAIACGICGVVWTERERIAALDALADAPDHGWRQTAEFSCCGEKQLPTSWDAQGRSLCAVCDQPSPYAGHAGFHVSKLYSKRHSLADCVREFLESKGDPELIKKWTNTCLAELFEVKAGQGLNEGSLLARAETYDGQSLPERILTITAGVDVQGDRLEALIVAWGPSEECWLVSYRVLYGDPAQPFVWQQLDALLSERFSTFSGRLHLIDAMAIDTGGHHAANVFTFASQHRGRRVFACKGMAGSKPLWPQRAIKSHTGAPLYMIGVDTAKEMVYSRLQIPTPEPGTHRPGYVHLPIGDEFGPQFIKGLNSERRETRKRMGQTYACWVKVVERNEPLDCFVLATAVRRSLPGVIRLATDMRTIAPPAPTTTEPPPPSPTTSQPVRQPVFAGHDDEGDEGGHQAYLAAKRREQQHHGGFVGARKGWMNRR